MTPLARESIQGTILVTLVMLFLAAVSTCTPPTKLAYGQMIADLREHKDAFPKTPAKEPCKSPIPDYDDLSKLTAAGYVLPQRIYWRAFDMNEDGKDDLYIEFQIRAVEKETLNIKIAPFPFKYFLDTDHDGYYDTFYKDMFGNGKCEEIIKYQPHAGDPQRIPVQ